MVRICGVDLVAKRQILFALTDIFGIGRSLAGKILKNTNVEEDKKVQDLTDDEVRKISVYIDNNIKTGSDLRNEISLRIKELIDLGTYRGIRHKKGLPVRGQRTKTNARTRKGKRKTVANKRIEAK